MYTDHQIKAMLADIQATFTAGEINQAEAAEAITDLFRKHVDAGYSRSDHLTKWLLFDLSPEAATLKLNGEDLTPADFAAQAQEENGDYLSIYNTQAGRIFQSYELEQLLNKIFPEIEQRQNFISGQYVVDGERSTSLSDVIDEKYLSEVEGELEIIIGLRTNGGNKKRRKLNAKQLKTLMENDKVISLNGRSFLYFTNAYYRGGSVEHMNQLLLSSSIIHTREYNSFNWIDPGYEWEYDSPPHVDCGEPPFLWQGYKNGAKNQDQWDWDTMGDFFDAVLASTDDYYEVIDQASSFQPYSKAVQNLKAAYEFVPKARAYLNYASNGEWDKALDISARYAGRGIGSAIGATIGKGIGAALGSVFGPGGTVVGYVAGSFIFGQIGGDIGEALGALFAGAMGNAAWQLEENEIKIPLDPEKITPPTECEPGPTEPVNLSPIVLDLTGAGVQTSALENSPVMFDLAASGVRIRTGWLDPKDGFLVFDRNGDGQINNGTELFGERTPRNGTENEDEGTFEYCDDGVEALTQEDFNGDGVLDARDPIWEHLRIWRDLNSNGRVDEDELFTLDELGIVALNLDFEIVNEVHNGNHLYAKGTYTLASGEQREMSDYFFAVDTSDGEFVDEIEVPEEIVDHLPNLNGSGMLRNLHEACTLSVELKDIVTAYTAAQTRAEQRDLLDSLLTAWADTSGLLATMEERNQGQYTIKLAINTNHNPVYIADCERKIHVMQAFNGRYMYVLPHEGNVLNSSNVLYNATTNVVTIEYRRTRMQQVDEAYLSYARYVYEVLLLQTRFKDLLESMTFSFDEESMTIKRNFDVVRAYFETRLAEDPLEGFTDLVEFTKAFDRCEPVNSWDGMSWVLQLVMEWELTPEFEALCLEHSIVLGPDEGNGYLTPVANRNTWIIARRGNNQLRGNNTNSYLIGGTGDDSFDGGNGSCYIDPGPGHNTITTGPGDNIIVFRKGYTFTSINAWINDKLYNQEPGRFNLVKLVGLLPNDVEFLYQYERLNGGTENFHMIIRIKETDDRLFIQSGIRGSLGYADCSRIQAVEFANGERWSFEQILRYGLHDVDEGALVRLPDEVTFYCSSTGKPIHIGNARNFIYGGPGNDTFYGGTGNDYIDPGPGHNTITTGPGDKIIAFKKGNAFTTVNAWINNQLHDQVPNRFNMIRLIDLLPEDVEFLYQHASGTNNRNMVVRIKETDDRLVIQDGILGSLGYADRSRIQAVEFANDERWSFEQILRKGLHDADEGNVVTLPDNTTFYGGTTGKTINVGGGCNFIYGTYGDDIIRCGPGGDHTVHGRYGNNKIYGGSDGATNKFLFARGFGDDSVEVNNPDGYNMVKLIDLNYDDVIFIVKQPATQRYYADLLIRIKATGETMTIVCAITSSSFYQSNRLNEVEFGDGSVLSFNDVLMRGIHVDPESANLNLFDSCKLYGNDGANTITCYLGDHIIFGGTGNNVITAGSGNDVIYSGIGNNKLYGGTGSNTFIFTRGNGYSTTLQLGKANSSNFIRLKGLILEDIEFGVVMNGSYQDLIIRIIETGDTITILRGMHNLPNYQFLTLEFGDGTVWSYAEVLQNGVISLLSGARLTLFTAGKLIGSSGDNRFNASIGDNVLIGGSGNDTLTGGTGFDILDGGPGNDSLVGSKGSNIFVFGRGYGQDTVTLNNSTVDRYNAVRLKGLAIDEVKFHKIKNGSYYDLIISIQNTDDELRIIRGMHGTASYEINAVEFADGSVITFTELKESGLIQ